VAVIGEFRSDLSITVRLTEILETFPQVFCSPKSHITENGGKRPLCRLQSISRDGILKDGRKMMPMHITLKAGIMRSQDQDCKYIPVRSWQNKATLIFNMKGCAQKCLALNELFNKEKEKDDH